MPIVVLVCLSASITVSGGDKKQRDDKDVSFKQDVFPIIRKYCLPCHAEESYNPSELSLDSYALLKDGGKHGSPVVVGNPEESILIQKLNDTPPFGDRMPLARRRKSQEPPKKLTEEEIKILTDWIKQGAKDN
jgi:hypothetical protein